MLKIFKYEWRKQLFSKLVIGCILLGLTLLYVAGMFVGKENWQEIALVLLVFAGMFAAMYVGIECLIVLNRDLKTKESHMLFMVPHSAYEILGAKILAAICQILLTGVLFAAAFFACFTAYIAANEGLAQFLNVLRQLLREWMDVDLKWDQILLVLAEIFLGWINMVAVGITSIIAVRTVLANNKCATLLAVVLFFLLNWGISRISQAIMDLADGWTEMMKYFWIQLGVLSVITVVLLLVSGWMAEKKLSV